MGTVFVPMSYTEAQKARFKSLCDRVNMKEITMNKAYQFANADGDTPDSKGFNNTFSKWVELARKYGWIEDVKSEINERQAKKDVEDIPVAGLGSIKDDKKHNLPRSDAKKYVLPIAIGIGAGIILIAIAKHYQKKKG